MKMEQAMKKEGGQFSVYRVEKKKRLREVGGRGAVKTGRTGHGRVTLGLNVLTFKPSGHERMPPN